MLITKPTPISRPHTQILCMRLQKVSVQEWNCFSQCNACSHLSLSSLVPAPSRSSIVFPAPLSSPQPVIHFLARRGAHRHPPASTCSATLAIVGSAARLARQDRPASTAVASAWQVCGVPCALECTVEMCNRCCVLSQLFRSIQLHCTHTQSCACLALCHCAAQACCTA